MYKLHLILKYLLKRRIAWVSLLAVMLCTTMVLVVISVMGGWLNMFKSSFRGLSGDIVVRSELSGFPYYQEMVAALEKHPDISAAIPTIETYGLLSFRGLSPMPARVLGIPIDRIGRVNRFPDSLFRQHTEIEQALAGQKLTTEQRKLAEAALHRVPSFDLLDVLTVPMDALPAGLTYAQPMENEDLSPGTIDIPASVPEAIRTALRGNLRFDEIRHELAFEGRMEPQWKAVLASLSDDAKYKQAIDTLYLKSQADLVPYQPIARTSGKVYGMIVGAGVIGIRRDRDGKWQGRSETVYETPAKLTVLGVQAGASIDIKDKTERTYFVVDDSRTQVWQYDNSYVYVDLARLQKDLGMEERHATDIDTQKPITLPGRVTEIHIKVRDGIDPNDEAKLDLIRKDVNKTVNSILARHSGDDGLILSSQLLRAKTWQDEQRVWIDAVENEKLLTVFLFGIISVVAIFLIFCIFYMIVVEKTRDIGIIKAVGATSGGVASIFLGYGLVIGLIGAGMGLLMSYGIVHNINELHTWMGKRLGLQIWNPEVYLFDNIPNKMSTHDVMWIVPIAVLASVLGALVPAVRAASVNPIESLRWE